jgi:hypothetical protein
VGDAEPEGEDEVGKEGEDVLCTEGFTEGFEDGMTELMCTEGFTEGFEDGMTELKLALEDDVCTLVGSVVDFDAGALEGERLEGERLEGERLGVTDGLELGLVVGVSDGTSDGAGVVGCIEGSTEGVGLGEDVGW